MAGIGDVVAAMPSAAFAIDGRRRVVAWNRAAAVGLGISASQAIGARCDAVIGAVDAATGVPCHTHCPLRHGHAGDGGHSRLLATRWRGGSSVPLDCLLLPCLLPPTERATLAVLAPFGARDARRHLRALVALATLYPALARVADPADGLGRALAAVVEAAGAEAGELMTLTPATGTPGPVLRAGLSAPAIPAGPPPAALAALLARADGALVVVSHPSADRSNRTEPADGWRLTLPLLAEGRLVGGLSLASRRADFRPAVAARVLLAAGGPLGLLLPAATAPARSARSAGAAVAVVPALRCAYFGAFRVERDGQALTLHDFKRHKALELLALLVAHRGRPLQREALLDLLWPEATPASAGIHLRVVVHALRRALEPGLTRGQDSAVIVCQAGQVSLAPTVQCWTDVEAFERLAAEAERRLDQGEPEAALAAGREAAALYAGDYLADLPDAAWCVTERERLRAVDLALLQRLADAHAARGQVAEAIDACRQALAADPLCEAAHRQVIALLWRAGRRDEALRQYATCRRLLREELAVAPEAATLALGRTINADPPHD